MPSYTLYPPIVESTANAFVAQTGAYCRVYFSLSRFSASISDVQAVHISVIKQGSGRSVVNTTDDINKKRYRRTGIIIVNGTPNKDPNKDNLYYIDILDEDIAGGWQSGWVYKIQLRLSTIKLDSGDIGTQAKWLSSNANNFSEWTTYCTTKATSKPTLTSKTLKLLDTSQDDGSVRTFNISSSTLDFYATYSNTDNTENLYSYSFQLTREDGTDENFSGEDSGPLYPDSFNALTLNDMHYTFKHNLADKALYKLVINFTTTNKYSESNVLYIKPENTYLGDQYINIKAIQEQKLPYEEEEGVLGLKIYSDAETGRDEYKYNGTLCVRRTDSRSNYQDWIDIKLIPCVDQIINNLEPFYDKTIESGVYYKYGVQVITEDGKRSELKSDFKSPEIRRFEYSYLLGENGRQLKLRFNNTMNNYTYNYSESKTDTLGGQFPFITRNGNTKYRSFPVNGLVSFEMDDNGSFATEKDIYKYSDVIESYEKERLASRGLRHRDFKKEMDFREEVLAFLQDGKPKLFKSPTEGNIIVRLMNVASQPEQGLGRLIYSFTSTAYEVAEATFDNCLYYNFTSLGDYANVSELGAVQTRKFFWKDESKKDSKDESFNSTVTANENLLPKLYNYAIQLLQEADKENKYNFNIIKFSDIHIKFPDGPILFKKDPDWGGESWLGNKIILGEGNDKVTIHVPASEKEYILDENVSFIMPQEESTIVIPQNESIKIGDTDSRVNISVAFKCTYSTTEKNANGNKVVDSTVSTTNVGQIFGSFKPSESLNFKKLIKDRFEIAEEESNTTKREVTYIKWLRVEGDSGLHFVITDEKEQKAIREVVTTDDIIEFEQDSENTGLKFVSAENNNQSYPIMIDYIYTITDTYSAKSKGAN